MRNGRTILDLLEEEYEDYEKHPGDWEAVTGNSNEDALNMMFPDGRDDD